MGARVSTAVAAGVSGDNSTDIRASLTCVTVSEGENGPGAAAVSATMSGFAMTPVLVPECGPATSSARSAVAARAALVG